MLKPNPNVMVSGGGVWEMMKSLGWSNHDGISAFIKEIPEELPHPSHRVGHPEKSVT